MKVCKYDCYTVSPATFVVAASDSLHKKRADYVCDGVDDQVEIQAAIDACSDVTTGIASKLLLLEGTYLISSTIVIDRTITLEGCGIAHISPYQNGLVLADNSDCDMINIRPPIGSNSLFFVKIINLKLNGNQPNQSSGSGIVISPRSSFEGSSDVIIKDCFLHSIKENAIEFKTGWHCHIENNWLESIGSTGITGYYSTVDKCNENFIIGNIIEAKHGINIGANQSSTNTVWRSTIISQNIFDCTDSGIILMGVEAVNISDNIFSGYFLMDNAIYLGGTATTPCKGVLILGNNFSDSSWGGAGAITNAITFGDGAYIDGLTIARNTLTNTSAIFINDLGAASIKNLVAYEQHSDLFMDTLVASADVIHAAITGTGAEQEITTAITNPDVPRNVSITNSANSTGDVIITGINGNGNSVTDLITIVTGGIAYGVVAFVSVSKITIPSTVANPDTITVGISDKLGLSNIIYAGGDVYKVKVNNADDPTIGTVNTTYHTVDCATINAADDITIWYRSNLNIIS